MSLGWKTLTFALGTFVCVCVLFSHIGFTSPICRILNAALIRFIRQEWKTSVLCIYSLDHPKLPYRVYNVF